MGLVQIIIDDTANKVITGSYTFDRANGGVLVVPSGTAFPGTPSAGETFWRTDLGVLYRRNDANDTWVAVNATAVAHATTHRRDGADPIEVGVPSDVGDANSTGTSATFSASDHVHRHGSQTTDTDHALVVAGVSHGFMSKTDKTAFDANLPSSGEKAALAGSYGTPGSGNKYVTQSDPLLAPGQIVTVGPSGCQFTSIAAAIASITDASATKPYAIHVSPGVYTESPFTMKAYVHVIGSGGWLDTVIKTNDNANHFITGTAGSQLSSVAIEGPTGNGYAAIDYTGTGTTPFFVHDVVIRKGYYGIYVHPASYGTIHIHEVVNQYAGSQINQLVRVTNGNATLIGCSFMSGPSNAVVTGFYFTGSTTTATMDICAFRNGGTTTAVFADDGANVRAVGMSVSAAGTGFRIGGTGTTTSLSITGVTIAEAVTVPVQTDTGSCFILISGVAFGANFSLATGTTITGLVADPDGATGTTVFGEIQAGPNLLPLTQWIENNDSAGLAAGGVVTVVSGLQVQATAGSGYVHDSNGAIKRITWSTGTTTLAASSNILYIYINNSGTLTSGAAIPDLTTNILLGVANTDGSAVRFLTGIPVVLENAQSRMWDYITEVVGPISVSGGVTTKHASPSLQLDVANGIYYIHNDEKTFTSSSPITFTAWYRDGSGKWTTVDSQTSIDTGYYDDGSGTLAALPANKHAGHLLFVSDRAGVTRFHVVYPQEYFNNAVDVVTNPIPPDVLLNDACRLARIVVQSGGTDIETVVDQRPKLGQLASGSTSITKHGDLSGLANDDHTQYQLRSEKGAASGYVPLNASTKVDNTYLQTATATGATVAVGAAAVGTGPKLAFEDHNHSISVGSPSTIGTANSAGVATSVPRSDHVHAHGAQTDGTLHAAVIAAGASGFMTGADKTKLDGIEAGANNTVLASTTPADVTKAAAAVGVSTTVARSDHKHDVSTASATANPPGTASAEGTATSLARSDHKHALAAFGTTATTFCEGNDSRLSNDRTASGLRSATTVVDVSAAAAPTTGQVLTATSGTAATWQTPSSGATLSTSEANATTNATTTSTTDVLMTSMTLTPGAGTWLAMFSGAFSNNVNGSGVNISLYVNGVQQNGTQRAFFNSNAGQVAGLSINKLITVGAGQAVEVRWNVSGNTGTVRQRSLTLVKVA